MLPMKRRHRDKRSQRGCGVCAILIVGFQRMRSTAQRSARLRERHASNNLPSPPALNMVATPRRFEPDGRDSGGGCSTTPAPHRPVRANWARGSRIDVALGSYQRRSPQASRIRFHPRNRTDSVRSESPEATRSAVHRRDSTRWFDEENGRDPAMQEPAE